MLIKLWLTSKLKESVNELSFLYKIRITTVRCWTAFIFLLFTLPRHNTTKGLKQVKNAMTSD